jgi:cyanophycinase
MGADDGGRHTVSSGSMTKRGAERKIARFKAQPMRPGDPRVRPHGRLIVIGGGEDKEDEKVILRQVALRAGAGRLVVATLATSEPKASFDEYEQVFRGLGVRHVYHFDVEERAEAESARAMQVFEEATCVFFTGGDQLKITSLIGDTPVFSRIYEIFAEGGTIAGTSAGAAIMTETMLIGGGQNGSHRIDENLRLGAGLGFAKDLVVDQHFAERGRISRLLAVVGQNPRIIGVGIDENTAIDIRPNQDFRVIGEGGVTVLDGSSVDYTNLAEEESDRTMSLFGVTLHLLSQGDVFDLRTREPRSRPAAVVDAELGTERSDDDEESD